MSWQSGISPRLRPSELLSRHLYDKETHFLLELIQNAEDNTYNHNVTPSLSFTYKPGSLRVDCNETGFTESNVRAICKIGESTKAGHGRSARYVGEKGIGFKSVFKIASEVYISSRSFSFKFDQSQPVGLIAPIWSEFPEPIRPGYTSFYLRLSGDSNEDRIAHDIQHLDPTMLLFLRRLREINLNVMLIDGKMWTRTLRREDVWTPDGFTTYLHRGPNMSNYIIVKHLVSKLPEDKDRLGVVESEISLAFPPLHETSDGHTHAVYAFLPIRDYGFKVGHFTLSPSFELELIYGKFLLQGDFLLTANREDILDNAWNRALLEACADAFVLAIHHLSRGHRKYLWTRYIPGQHMHGFFEPLRDMILEKLSQEPILEACSGRMVAPVSLTYVPPSRFTDDAGLPLTLSPNTKDSYLSSSYVGLSETLLSRLGTRTLDGEGFLQDLSSMISNDSQLFRQKSDAWHEKLADALLTLYDEENHQHIVFMFRASFHPSPGVDLWFATADNRRVKGSSLYIRAISKPGSFEDRIRNHRSTGEPLKATVVYIYERIQADYMNNKKEIRKSFMQKPLIYTSLYSSESDPKMCWITGKECLEKNLDIVKEYESSTTLFRNVLGTGTNAIERRVQSLRAITEDTSLDDIVASFVEMDRLIQALGSQRFKAASEKLNKWFPVFPILKNWNDNEYDELAPLNPPFPPWFIADREHLRDSFCGSVNILAISPRDISSIQIFLEALDLQPRVLSTIVKVESHPLGKPKLHAPYTKSLRRKATFITALIPKQRDGRDTLVEGVFRVEVNIAAEIAQKYTFEYGGRSFSGAEGPGEVALSERSGRLQVFMTRENISATVPPPELGNQICDRYGIVNPSHRNLIQFALGEDSPRRLASTFAREGIHALDPPLGVSDNEFSALSRDEFLDTRATDGEDETQDGGKDKFESKFKYIPTKFLDEIDEEDRRLPLQYFKWSERILFRNTSCDPGTDYRTVLRQEPAHGQYAAEVLTSVFLQQELGSSYKPDDHWTSPQRYKAGYCKFPHPVASYATFTIANREASRKFSDVLAQRGFQDARSWAWANSDPAYHLDMAVSSGGPTSDFSWTSQQFERMRAFRTDRQQKVGWRLKDVHVLVRVSNVFTSPNLDLFVDSWRLFSSERFALHGNWTFAATILDASLDDDFDSSVASDQRCPSILHIRCLSDHYINPRTTSFYKFQDNLCMEETIADLPITAAHGQHPATASQARPVTFRQSNEDEKSEQVRLLPQVFQRATCVLVCLGSDSKGDSAMEALMQIRVHDALATLGEEWPKDLAKIPQTWGKRSIPPPDDPIWTDVGALFERPWFERAWIIQELLVATSVRVICGKWMIDWNDLLSVVKVITRDSEASSEQTLGKAQAKFTRFSTLAKLREREAKHERRPLLDLLEHFRASKSSIDHDRFFCLLGLAIDGNNKDFCC
ncbi:hypothetical protein CEP52_015037 [Fusarium oligoseptatum]|uniref:Heterokaryon incompatibility domain-containing protein n=1 Tax=Fusarium oligoseptatum TaxID=2604345 RepID=A0A428SGR7_9HYPO|nr:hypothetical protein CEP52_015037 [Fusarium oligoseptatum]